MDVVSDSRGWDKGWLAVFGFEHLFVDSLCFRPSKYCIKETQDQTHRAWPPAAPAGCLSSLPPK